MTVPTRARACLPAALLQALRVIDRDGYATVDEVRSWHAHDGAGDQVVEGVVARGYVERRGDRLTLTDAGRRALVGASR